MIVIIVFICKVCGKFWISPNQFSRIQDGKLIYDIVTGKSFITLEDINLKIINYENINVSELYKSKNPLKERILLDFIKPNNLSGFKKSFSYTMKIFWNGLELFVQNLKTSELFANYIKNNLICLDQESERIRLEIFDGTLYRKYQKARQMKKFYRNQKKSQINRDRIICSLFTELLGIVISRSQSSSPT